MPLAALGICAAWIAPPETRPVPPGPARFADEIAGFAEWDRKNAWPQDAILFVGSSSIRLWATRASFPLWPVINRGFGGSRIAEVQQCFPRVVEPYGAKVIVFYAGDNDITDGLTPAQVRDDFAAFVQTVRARQPRTPIVFLSIKPSKARWEHWPQMQAANALIRELAEKDATLTYVDVGGPLLGTDGQPRAELYRADQLHLSDAGYAIWTRTLTPVLQKLLQ
jgi:lysophospholipase L1-like esterase